MKFVETPLAGAYIIDIERKEDERGFFALSWRAREFTARGLDPQLAECNISFNARKGTLRGMHYQAPPHGQAKLVRCTMGAIYDVIIDLRPDSPTFKQWTAVELTAENRRMLFIPAPFAHGFQTLMDNSEVFYQMSTPFVPESGRGVRWDDKAFGITWPLAEKIMNERDRTYPDFVPGRKA